jgi:hypothetical protein
MKVNLKNATDSSGSQDEPVSNSSEDFIIITSNYMKGCVYVELKKLLR